MDMCEQAGCSETIAKLHFRQYMDSQWNPHPPQKFMAWWGKHAEHEAVPPAVAFNTELYRSQYQEAKEVGLI